MPARPGGMVLPPACCPLLPCVWETFRQFANWTRASPAIADGAFGESSDSPPAALSGPVARPATPQAARLRHETAV
jgi:hypothetical protein